MLHVLSLLELTLKMFCDRKSGINPIVRIDHVFGYASFHMAINGVSEILLGRDDEREDNQHHECSFVVEPKDVVYADRFQLQQNTRRTNQTQHLGILQPSNEIRGPL
jgi:hypothetical protein